MSSRRCRGLSGRRSCWGRVRSARRSSRAWWGRVVRTRPCVAGCSHQRTRGVRVRWGGQARLPRHVFAPGDAHDGIVGHGQGGLNQFSDRTSVWWGSCRSSSSQPGRVRASRRLGRREAADLAVAQAVVDEREDLARQRDACFVLAAPFGDLAVLRVEDVAAVIAADALDQRRSAPAVTLAWRSGRGAS